MDYYKFRVVKNHLVRFLVYLALFSALVPLFSILYEVVVRAFLQSASNSSLNPHLLLVRLVEVLQTPFKEP
jgi:hypothetical protein